MNNPKTKSPAIGGDSGTVVVSNLGGADSPEYITTNVICVTETPKGVLLKSQKSADELWFPKKQVVIINGEYGAGAELTVKIKPEVIRRARQNKAENQQVRFASHVRVVGYAKHQTPKAYIVVCDADGAERPFAKSRIIAIKTDFIDGQPVELVVPAWMLKCRDETFPSWVKGAMV